MSISRDRTLRAAMAALTTTGLLAVAGCGDNGSADPASSSSSTSGATSGSSATDSPSQTSGGSGSAAAASGPLMPNSRLTIHAPKGWKVQVAARDMAISAFQDLNAVNLTIVTDVTTPFPLGRLAHQAITNGVGIQKAEVVDPVTMGGQPAFHVVGRLGPQLVGAAGTQHGDVVATVEVVTSGSRQRNEQILQSVLASVQWK